MKDWLKYQLKVSWDRILVVKSHNAIHYMMGDDSGETQHSPSISMSNGMGNQRPLCRGSFVY